jgi:hypothetical protein
MAGADSRGSDWTDREIDLIVADYFAMLQMELADQPFVKSHRNAALRQLIDRSGQSIGFKHCNISSGAAGAADDQGLQTAQKLSGRSDRRYWALSRCAQPACLACDLQ